jgi:hypothetical protein
MSIVVACGKCGKQYRVGEELIGRRAKCQQCGAEMVIAAPEPAENRFSEPPLQAWAPPPPASQEWQPPIATWTDRQIRLGAAVVVPVIALGMLAAFFAGGRGATSFAEVVVIGLGPFGVFYGIAGLVNPDILRAATKYGGHLPRRYKLIAAAVGVAALACSLPLTLSLLSR